MRKTGFCLVTALFWMASPSLGSDSAYPRILGVEGDVVVIHGGQPAPAVEDAGLAPGDVLEAGSGGHVDVKLSPAVTMRVNAGGRCELAGVETSSLRVKLLKGALAANVQPLPRDGSFTVETPPAVAAVRGTRFLAKLGAEGADATFVVRKGKVFVTSKGSSTTVSVETGQAVDVSPKSYVPVVRQATREELDLADVGDLLPYKADF
jgi:ferric-dicitrate binding protein FerR (iron transport regulator)